MTALETLRRDLDDAWESWGEDLTWFEAGEAEHAGERAAFGDSAPGSALGVGEARAAYRAEYEALSLREVEYCAVQGLCPFPS